MSIAKAIMAATKEERDMWEAIEECKAFASRLMFCPFTGKVLDTRTVVIVRMPGTNSAPVAMHGDAWDTGREAFYANATKAGYGPEAFVVIDGRELEKERKAFANAKRRAARNAS